MYLIIGLGNPGKRYEKTRHNMGFMAIDQLAKELGTDVKRVKFKSFMGEGRIGQEKVILVKPQTFMNLSGEAVREAFDFYKPAHHQVILIYDDLDLPLGGLRIRQTGGPGTHRGMQSVVQHLGFQDFPRVGIGIGINGSAFIWDYLICVITKIDSDKRDKTVSTACQAILSIVEEGADRAMNKFNRTGV